MKETTAIRTPYEEMHRSFVLRLIELKNEHGVLRKLREFLQCFVGIRSGIEEAIILKPPCDNVLRGHFKLKPITILEGEKQIEQPQPDWIIDFLFFDNNRRISYALDFLSAEKENQIDAKRALIHFGCSPNSYSGDITRRAFVVESSDYAVFHSIGQFEMSLFLGDGDRFEERFFKAYARIIDEYAEKKAIATWQKNAQAFSFLCEKIIAEKLEKRIGKSLLIKTSFLSKTEATVCFTLPHFKWSLFDGDKLAKTIYGLTIHVHFVAGEPFAHLGLSHRGPMKAASLSEETISKDLYEKLFLRRFDLSKAGFNWARDIKDPLDDEFAYSNKPIWIRPETRLGSTRQDRCGHLVDDIAEIFEHINKNYSGGK